MNESFFIEEKAAIKVTIPGDARIGTMRLYRFRRGSAVLGQQGIGDTVREASIRFVLNLDKLNAYARCNKCRLDGIDHMTGYTVTGVNGQFERFQVCRDNPTQQVINIVIQYGCLFQGALGCRLLEFLAFGNNLANLPQPAVATNRRGAPAHGLHAVVVRRLTAVGHLDASIYIKMAGGEAAIFGADITK